MSGRATGESRPLPALLCSLISLRLVAKVACLVVIVMTTVRVLNVIESMQEQAIVASEAPMTVASWASWAPSIAKGLVRSFQLVRAAEEPGSSTANSLLDMFAAASPASVVAIEDVPRTSWDYMAEKLCSLVACEALNVLLRRG